MHPGVFRAFHSADLRFGIAQLLGVPCNDRHVGAAFACFHGQSKSDAAGAAGDEEVGPERREGVVSVQDEVEHDEEKNADDNAEHL